MRDQFDDLTREQLLALVRAQERRKKLGLVWEREAIERDRALDENFIALALDPTLSDGGAPFPNLVIEGDNFDALRWLRMTCARRFRCIFIDPPYNTGNRDWVYNDHYVDKEDAWRHSTWLEFLYQRLMIARDLLAPDGVLLVHINDDNRGRLDLLLEEIFPAMRIGSFVWRVRTGGNDTKGAFLSINHEHVLIYAAPGFRFGGAEKTFAMYKFWDENEQESYRLSDLSAPKDRKERPETFYPLEDPATGIWYPCNPDRVWAYASKKKLKPGQRLRHRTIEELIDEGRIHFPVEQRVEI